MKEQYAQIRKFGKKLTPESHHFVIFPFNRSVMHNFSYDMFILHSCENTLHAIVVYLKFFIFIT